MIKRQVLVPLAVLLVVSFVGSGVLKNERSGPLEVLSYACWFAFLGLGLFFVAVAVVAIVRNRRRLAGRP